MRISSSVSAVLVLALAIAPAALADATPTTTATPPGTGVAAAVAVEAGPGACPAVDRLGNPTAEPTFVSAGPCYVQRQCDDGSTISCNGSSTCSSGTGTGGGYVTCDGVTTWCPEPTQCSDGQYCKFDSMCGTCGGYACVCRNNVCICP